MYQFDLFLIIVLVLFTHVVELFFVNRLRNQLAAMDKKLDELKAALSQNK